MKALIEIIALVLLTGIVIFFVAYPFPSQNNINATFSSQLDQTKVNQQKALQQL